MRKFSLCLFLMALFVSFSGNSREISFKSSSFSTKSFPIRLSEQALGVSPSYPYYPVTEQDFFYMLKQIEDIYVPIFKRKGMVFKIQKHWGSKEINTNSYYDEDNFEIMIPGELARHRKMTIDSLALAACHEIGHYLGGSPRKVENGIHIWSSVEGQADYFAASKCLKRIFSNRSENRAAYRTLNEELRAEILKICKSYQCARIVAAAWSLVKVIEDVENDPVYSSLGKRDSSIVYKHWEEHPSNQCRLDTFVAGATCKVSINEEFDPYDSSAGACLSDSLDPEEVKSARPRCWFALN